MYLYINECVDTILYTLTTVNYVTNLFILIFYTVVRGFNGIIGQIMINVVIF